MSASPRKTILVPTDFTSVALLAIDHGLKAAKEFDSNLCLMHLVNKSAPFEEKKKKEQELKTTADTVSKYLDVNSCFVLKEGNIFDGISETASERNAEIIIMGVHSRGSDLEQEVLGHFAYSVIRNAPVPVMIVKKTLGGGIIKHIVVPVDYTDQSNKKAEAAIKYAKFFQCPVYVTADVFFERSTPGKVGLKKVSKENFLKNIVDKIRNEGIIVKSDIFVKSKTILVPVDFTPDANKAIEHALDIATTFGRNICLLHVVGADTNEKQKKILTESLGALARKINSMEGVSINFMLKTGSIFDIITSTASEISAGMIVMAYHGKQEIKKLSKGFAFDAIRDAKVPVMMVKKSHQYMSENVILITIDYPSEKLTKLNKGIKIASHYQCPLQIIVSVQNHPELIEGVRQKIEAEIEEFLKDEEVNYQLQVQTSEKCILIPIDFSSLTPIAIEQGFKLGRIFNLGLHLMHVVKEQPSERELVKMNNTIHQLMESYKNEIEYIFEVEKGSIFNEITTKSRECNARFIVMGIHGKKGLQYLLGSHAYKVISKADVPVLALKAGTKLNDFDNIVMPVDSSNINRDEIVTAIEFAKYFNSVLHVVSVQRQKGSVHKIQQEAFLVGFSKHIQNAGIKVQSKVIEKKNPDMEDDIIDFARNIDADLILVMAQIESRLAEFFGQNYAANMIDKSNIPILVSLPTLEYDDEEEDTTMSTFIDPLGLKDI